MPEMKRWRQGAWAAVLLAATVCLLSCPAGPSDKTSSAPAAGSQAAASAPALHVVLVRSDLGLGDGQFVREADTALTELAKQGLLEYTPVGALPVPQTIEAGVQDVGLADAASEEPGTMTVDQAKLLLADIPACDWLVLSSPLLVEAAATKFTAGELKVKAIVLLDEEGCPVPANLPVPLVRVRYKIKDVAFLCGVASAASSNNGMILAFANAGDPQASDFLSAVSAGAKYWTAGAVIYTATVPEDPATGEVTPEKFRDSLNLLLKEAGPYFASNHYILALGRSTPAVMNAVSRGNINAFVTGGYADYRVVQPKRIIGCAEKHPGVALKWILSHLGPGGLAGLAPNGVVELGLNEDVVGFTGIDLYAQYHEDADDIRQAVEGVEKQIRAGVLDYKY